MKPIRMFAATGMLGYGYADESIERALEMELDLIAADAGSMDPGPYYLGAGQAFVSRPAAKRDLSLMMVAPAESLLQTHPLKAMAGQPCSLWNFIFFF